MKHLVRTALFALTIGLGFASAETFEARFDAIRRSATPSQLYSLLWDLPKGGDLHNHFGLANWAERWEAIVLNPQRNHGNEFFTRVKFNNCADSTEPLLRFYHIQRSTFRKLSACRQAEYVSLGSLSPKLRQEWLSSLKLDQADEGRNEFFEVYVRRVGELLRDPWIATEMLVDNMQFYSAQGLRYLETQMSVALMQDHEGNPMPPETAVDLFRAALNRPDAKATAVTVRFLLTIRRFTPTAEEDLEKAYAFVDAHRDLWVGINMAGREDNDKGFPLRFLETYRKMRRKYSGIRLSIHGGEVDSPGQDVRKTLMLGATRIGHGVNLITDPDTMLLMQNQRALVEINLISNRLLEYTPELAQHPFPEYLRFGIPVCLNTDDPGAWDSHMTDEYFEAVSRYHLTWGEIVQIGRDSLRYSFVEDAIKQRLVREYDAAVQKFVAQYESGNWQEKLKSIRPTYSGYARRNLAAAVLPQ